MTDNSAKTSWLERLKNKIASTSMLTSPMSATKYKLRGKIFIRRYLTNHVITSYARAILDVIEDVVVLQRIL